MAPAAADPSENPIRGVVHWHWQAHAHGAPTDPVAAAWLARMLDVRPEALNLGREPRGRPRLGPPQAAFDCSWSHSGDGLLIALGRDVELGVDCERMRPRPRALDLAQRYFTGPEHDWLAGFAAGPTRDRAFLRLWCAKEAVLKAHGHGLSFGLEKLRFAESGGGLVLAECASGLGRAGDWTLHEFAPAPGYVAAAAWRAPPRRAAGPPVPSYFRG